MQYGRHVSFICNEADDISTGLGCSLAALYETGTNAAPSSGLEP